ncbi:MAG: aspartate carbamoyltransferase regulatory subunit [Prevotella sp.]|jgi:aspartate carbamoyltransferase regulatory subunit|nr:aspartate carbamoyltransferase regulatory subunit [Prevotella sp.]MDY6318975.1 aspartate carbamoyltransferase regulatory subunit [Prevotella sp.]
MGNKELLVSAIENGTVIDHIPTNKTFQVVNLLHLQDMDTPVTIGYNYKSGLMGSKGIIKISDKFFTDDEINRLSVVAPNIVLNTIRNYEVVEKRRVETPDELRGIIRCNNPKCITNNEPMETIFNVVDKRLGIVKCHYCDKEQNIEDVELV